MSLLEVLDCHAKKEEEEKKEWGDMGLESWKEEWKRKELKVGDEYEN